MEFTHLVEIVGEEPVFETGLLLAGDVNPHDVHRQLSRWTRAGWLYQLRRGLYALAPPFQKVKPHPFVVANRMVRGSYVSCQSALAHYGLIPEHVPVVISVSALRTARWNTSLGAYEFRHIKADLFRGYISTDLGKGQRAFLATPEKALLDQIHLQPRADARENLRELRLQNTDCLNLIALQQLAESMRSPKLKRAAKLIVEFTKAEQKEYEPQ